MDSVGQRNAPGLLRLGGQIETTHAGDPTIKVCAFLNNQILTWLKALSLKEQGLDAKTSAERLGIHPYPFSKDVLPQAETWGKTRLVQLLDLTCTAERNLKRGSVRPWVYLLSNLAKLCER
jgi:DNA polymerase III delta subunit